MLQKNTTKFHFLTCGLLTVSLVMGLHSLSAQEICNNGMDDDGNGLIDCFDPACCEECPEHYYTDCDESLCETGRAQGGNFDWRLNWQFSGEWDNINTPLVGILRQSEGPVVVGISTEEVGTVSKQDILIIEGRSGNLLRRISTPPLPEYATTIGLADVTGNGEGNIIAGLSEDSPFSRSLECYDPDGNLVWISDQPHGYSTQDVHASPLFADFNEDSVPEIYVGNMIFDGQTGRRLIVGGSDNHRGAQEARQPGYRFFSPVAADVLPDSLCGACEGLELIAGAQVYAVDIPGETMRVESALDTSVYRDGFTAVNDMNNDGSLDVLVAQRRDDQVFLYIWNPRTEQIIGQFTYNSPVNTMFTGASSVPLLTDLNNDGFTDIVISTSMLLVAIQNNGDGTFSVLWEIDTQDLSGRSGPVAFDFTGDGNAEIVHRGQDRIITVEGSSGDLLAQDGCFSSTYLDKVIVANIDDEPQAEILVSCGNNLVSRTSRGDPWKSARPVWNQLPFFNTHITDQLGVPARMQAIHLPETAGQRRLNRYMEQFSRPESPGPDFVFDTLAVVCENGSKFIEMTVCNRGDLRSPVQVFIAAYAQDPLNMLNPPVWNVQEPLFLDPGECLDLRYVFPPFGTLEEAFFTLNIPPGLPFIDTTDTNSFLTPECQYNNNFERLDLSPFLLRPINLGTDTFVCAADVSQITLDTDTSYRSYMWSTGEMSPAISVNQSGVYSLRVTDNCGNQGLDSIRVTFQEPEDFNLPADTSVCLLDRVLLEVDNNFDQVVWVSSSGDTLCENCPILDLEVTGEVTVSVAGFFNGCESADSVRINVLPSVSTSDTLQICSGDSVQIRGEWVGPGIYSQSFSTPLLCDSLAITVVESYDPLSYEVQKTSACGQDSDGEVMITSASDSFDVQWSDGSSLNQRSLGVGVYPFRITDGNGCSQEDTVVIDQIQWERSGWSVVQPECFAGRDTLVGTPVDGMGEIVARLGADTSFSWFVNGEEIQDSIYTNTAPDPGIYGFEIRKEGCTFQTQVQIFEVEPARTLPSEDIAAVEGDLISLGNELSAGPFREVSWNPTTSLSCEDCIPAELTATQDIQYLLQALDEEGCPFQKTYRVFISMPGVIAIPNVFSPNGDGINDQFVLNASQPIQALEHFRVFDRWGSLLFELRGGEGTEIELWDGRSRGVFVNPGVYVYSLRLIDISGQIQERAGSITVLR